MSSRSKSPLRRGTQSRSAGQHKPLIPFGTFRFDYMRECRHDFKSNNCPFCLLVTSSVKAFFAEEADKTRKGRIDAKRNRAKLRYSLLDSWTRNQPTHYRYSLTHLLTRSPTHSLTYSLITVMLCLVLLVNLCYLGHAHWQ